MYYPAGNYLLKVNKRKTTTRCKICSKLKIKKPVRRRLTSFRCFYRELLNRFHTFFKCFYCLLQGDKCQLGGVAFEIYQNQLLFTTKSFSSFYPCHAEKRCFSHNSIQLKIPYFDGMIQDFRKTPVLDTIRNMIGTVPQAVSYRGKGLESFEGVSVIINSVYQLISLNCDGIPMVGAGSNPPLNR